MRAPICFTMLLILGCRGATAKSDFPRLCQHFEASVADWEKLPPEEKAKLSKYDLSRLAIARLLADSPSRSGKAWLAALLYVRPGDHLALIDSAAAEAEERFDCPAFRRWDQWLQEDERKREQGLVPGP